jgi:hypothetical protein
MPVVLLLLGFPAGNDGFIRVYNDYIITNFLVRGKNRLGFSPDHGRNLGCDTAHDFSLCVNDIPFSFC